MLVTRTANPSNCKAWQGCHPMANVTPQMTKVCTESKTMQVLADISLVTEIPGQRKYSPTKCHPYEKEKIIKNLLIRKMI